MFHLLVSYAGWDDGRGWQDNLGSLDLGRSITNHLTDEPLVGRFRPNGDFSLAEITQYPALIMTELEGRGAPFARVGNITNVKKTGREAIITYRLDPTIPPISTQTIKDSARDLGLTDFQLIHTHWSVNNGDLFEVLFRNSIGAIPKPDVFNIDHIHQVEQQQLSVMMPFAGNFTPVYQAIQTMAADMGMRCNRADDIWVHQHIMQDVVSLICKSSVVICDLSGKNPNVFYEAGIAHALGKQVILITQHMDDIPFDLRSVRAIQYLANGEGIDAMITKLRPRISQLTGGHFH
jgi:nucleoside 2-deoxyribosyltransferase